MSRNRKGFTLLEMIVAGAIFTAVVAGAYALFDGSRRLAARAEARADLLQTARAALRAIEADLKGALMSGSAYDTGFIGADSGTLDTLELVSVTSPTEEVSEDAYKDATKTRRSDLSKVYYWVEQDQTKAAHGLVRERLGTLLPPESRTRREEDVETVSAEVVGLNLRYYDGQWRDTWNSRTTGRMPRAVEVAVRVKREDEEETHTARFYLPVAAETPEVTPQ